MDIASSVGDGGANLRPDVQYVQSLLNISREVDGLEALALDGRNGPKTIAAIRAFQTIAISVVDGLVEPGRATIRALEAQISDVIGELRTISSLALVVGYEPIQEEPAPESEPTLDDSQLMALVQSLMAS
jgi:peptidoglycan hydrolase-like protein with peptidoglycan-binding domain